MAYAKTLSLAVELLYAAHPRMGNYAYDVLDGTRRWSGSDLRGNARKYSSTYWRAREAARDAWFAAGGSIVALRRTGLRVSAVRLCVDDYGTTIYDTEAGHIPAVDLR